MIGAFLAVDWGTTNRRAWRIEADGVIAAAEQDDRGALAVSDFAAEAVLLRNRLGDLPMLCAGMVGSNRGWAEVPYLPCPATLDALAGALHWVEPGRTAIIPGVSTHANGRSDVMRGEEVQFLGAAAALIPSEALLCQPGTHSKWAWLRDNALVDFHTAMTGEVYALLRDHSLLAAQMRGSVAAGPDFERGLADAADGDLLGHLFGVRARFVTGRGHGDAAAYVSGLLIGSDTLARLTTANKTVHVLADPSLGALYATAIAAAGGTAILIDSRTAFLAGVRHIWSRIAS